jgi:membrane-bound lytic murein transglycosylase MltF
MKLNYAHQPIADAPLARTCCALNRISLHHLRLVVYLSLLLTLVAGCGGNAKPAESSVPGLPTSKVQAPVPMPPPAQDSGLETTEAVTPATHVISLPTRFEHWKGDLDGMVKRKLIRALVINSKAGFFFDRGRPRGLNYEALQEFDKFVNKKLGNPIPAIKVAYIPVSTSQLASALKEGMGDIAATGIIITPEREKEFDFTAPLMTGVKLILVTNVDAPTPKSLDELSGQEVWVNPVTISFHKLQSLNESLKKAGKPEIKIMASDSNLTEEDLLEMTNSGLIPATVAFDFRAKFWAQIYPNIRLQPDIVLQEEGDIGWAMRKNSPQLKQMLNEFSQSHEAGTTFGNMMLTRYLKNTNWVKNSTNSADMQKFNSYIQYFKKYGAEYDFDFLMLAAQGYQESMLDQNRRSRAGAVGVMQVIPKYAAANPINIPNVNEAEPNIHAGAKMLHNITVTYFNDPEIKPTDKTLFTFAAYNAGPSRVKKLRRMATEQGLNPNIWFGNVELMAAKDIGQETVQYVSNIYKYYVAYKTSLEEKALRAKAMQSLSKQ